MPALLAPSLNRTRTGFALVIALIALFAAEKAVVYDTLDPDCFWHLRVGEQLLREGVRPLTDSLSFASIREPWVPYSWLAEIGMVKIWAVGGLSTAVGIAALMQATFVVFVALSGRELVDARWSEGKETNRRWLAAVLGTAFATFLSLPYLSFRPVTFAIVVLSFVTWLLLRDRRRGERSRIVWLIIPIAALLANIHFFGFLIPAWVAALLAGSMWERWAGSGDTKRPEHTRRVRRYAWMLLLATPVSLATPLLPGVLRSIWHYGLLDPIVNSPVISEMQPFYAGGAGRISLGLVLIFAACGWIKRDRVRVGERVWLLIGTVLLLKLGRLSPIFALLAGPIFALTLPELSDRLLVKPMVQIAVVIVLLIGGFRVVSEFPNRRTDLARWLNRLGPETPGYPTASADFIASHVRPSTGRLVNEFAWGGYLEWRLGDRFQLLLDGRTQLFTPEFWRATYLGGEESRRGYLDTLSADAAVVPVQNSIFRSSLVSLGWRSVHRDDRAEVLVPPASAVVEIEP